MFLQSEEGIGSFWTAREFRMFFQGAHLNDFPPVVKVDSKVTAAQHVPVCYAVHKSWLMLMAIPQSTVPCLVLYQAGKVVSVSYCITRDTCCMPVAL